MEAAQVTGYDRYQLSVTDLKIVNRQRVKKARFEGESYWSQQVADGLLILLSGDLTVHYTDRQHPLAPGELFPLHRLNYYRLSSRGGAEIVSVEELEVV